MDSEKVYTTSLRLYKKRPVHAQAYQYLKNYNTDIFKTKDDFIAEAIIHFSMYLQQEEDAVHMEKLNHLIEQQNQRFVDLVKNAIFQMQEGGLYDTIKKAVQEVVSGNLEVANKRSTDQGMRAESDLAKDLQFARFYDFDDD